MKISFERSGGFAGLHVALNVDLNSLPASDAVALQKLVKDADFFNLPEGASGQTRADGFQYMLSVQADGHQRTMHLSDGSIPDKLQPLLNDLGIRARSQQRGVA